jgi:hypothetical protein
MPDVSYSLGGVRNEQQTEADRTKARMAQMMFEREMRSRAEQVARQNAELGANLTREGWGREDARSDRGLEFQRDIMGQQAAMTREGWGREDARSDRGLQFQKDILTGTLAEQRAAREEAQKRWEQEFDANDLDRSYGREQRDLTLEADRLRAKLLRGEITPDQLTSAQRMGIGAQQSPVEQLKEQEKVDIARAGTTAGRRDLLKEQEKGFSAIGQGVKGESWFSNKDATRYATQASMLINSLRDQGADDRAINAAKQRLINEINMGSADWTFGTGGKELESLKSAIQAL